MYVYIGIINIRVAFSQSRARARGVNELGPGGVLFHFRPAERATERLDDGAGEGYTRKKRLIAHCDSKNNNNTITGGRVGLSGEGHVKRLCTRI
jgi:hypothetical protein